MNLNSSHLTYRQTGSGKNGIICIHGWMVSGAVFDPILGALESSGATVIVADQRGSVPDLHDATDFSLDGYVGDITELIQNTSFENYVLIGHSMGGQIAQLVAARLPEKVVGLVLVNSVPLTGMQLPDEAATMFRNSGGDSQAQGQILDMACTSLNDAEKTRLLDLAKDVSASCIADSFDAWTGGAPTEVLADIEAATLVIATDDPFLPPAFLQETIVDPIKNARMVELSGCGHYPQCEKPQETSVLINTFLEELSF